MTVDRISCVASALVVGGGIGGMAAAISLAERGVAVELIDIDPDWRVYGAGITITGPTLRAYRQLELLERIRADGAVTEHARLYRYDGVHLRDIEQPAIEDGIAGNCGIMRPVLHRIVQERVRALDIPVRLGLTISALEDEDDGVAVTYSDGTYGRFDLVVGADSISSQVRELCFSHMAPARPTGQGCWRIAIRKPPELQTGEFYFGHANPCGITVCGPDAIYLWMLTPHQPRERHFDDEELYTNLKALLADFGGNVGWIRDNMTRGDWINYRPLAAALQPRPWSSGRVVLLGDAVHATTPHLASGAGLAVESAIVLAEELATHDDVLAGLRAYEERRFDRCRDVVESSVAIGALQLNHGAPDQIAGLIEGALARLNAAF